MKILFEKFKALPTWKRRVIGGLLGLMAYILLSGVWSDAPSDAVIQESAFAQFPPFHQIYADGGFVIDDFKVINHYTKEVNKEKVHFYEFTLDSHFKDQPGDVKHSKISSAMVKRGNSWYFLK